MKLVVGITGATGAIYGVRLLQYLANTGGAETHLIVSDAGRQVIEFETAYKMGDIERLATQVHDITDLAAAPSSGTFRADGMVVIPCTVKTLSALANSNAENLLVRAGDVVLKERRRLVVVVRETPLHLGHIRLMERLTEMGGVILPPVPAFYGRPQTIDNIVDHTVGKVLDLFDIPHNLYQPWTGTGG